MTRPKVVIVGAGIGGLTAAVALRAKGIDAEIVESAESHRDTGSALGLASNGVKVLRALNVDLGTGTCGQSLEHFEICTPDGRLIRSLPVPEMTDALGDPIVSIHRNDLIQTLEKAIGEVPVRFGARVVELEIDATGVSVSCADGRRVQGDVLIGADGIRSVVRASMTGSVPPTAYNYVCWLATVPFSHPRMVSGYCGHYWGRGQRFGLVDIGGGTAYWWGTKNMPAALAGSRNTCKEDVLAAFEGWSPEIPSVIAQTPEEAIVSVPAQDRPFLKRWGTGRVSLLGDAAHPMQTALAQGAGSAVEDAYVLAECLARIPDPVAALRRYESLRRRRTKMLVRRSRRTSKLEQLQNPAAGAVRNTVLRFTPKRTLMTMNVRPMRFDLAWEQR